MKKNKDISTRKTFAGIMRYLKPYWGFLAATVLLALVQVAATLAVPYFAGLAINRMIGALPHFLRNRRLYRRSGAFAMADESFE